MTNNLEQLSIERMARSYHLRLAELFENLPCQMQLEENAIFVQLTKSL
jgi:hypothetical protein